MRVVVVLLLALLSGCASIERIESGPRKLGERLQVEIDGAWNHVNAPGMGPALTWTMEGLPVDQLLIYSGLPSDRAIHAEGGGPQAKRFVFKAGMRPDEIAGLFEGMFTRDQSRFTLARIAPAEFGGQQGFRFDFELLRQVDNVALKGFGYATVSKDQLFAIVYLAPRLAFFPRHAARAEAIAKSARIRD